MIKGTYTNTYFEGDLVHKSIEPDSNAERHIFGVLSDGVDINEYISKISQHVTLPKTCEFKDSRVTQTVIDGPNVDEFLVNADADNPKVLEVYQELIKIYKKIKADDSLTIDFNMFNFIINDEDGKLVFVDVTPPLYLDKVKNLDDRFKSQRELFMNKPLQLISFSMYYLLPFIYKDCPKRDMKALFYGMVKVLAQEGVLEDFNTKYDHMFSDRKNLFLRWLNGDVENFKQQFVSYDIKNDLNAVGENLFEVPNVNELDGKDIID